LQALPQDPQLALSVLKGVGPEPQLHSPLEQAVLQVAPQTPQLALLVFKLTHEPAQHPGFEYKEEQFVYGVAVPQ